MRLHDLIAVTRDIFTREFGYVPLLCVQAPTVNLIGEHTDYNDGFVLPCAIDYQTVISCAPRSLSPSTRHRRRLQRSAGQLQPQSAHRHP